MFEWSDLLAALALCLILEGLIPLLSPGSFRRFMEQMTAMPDSALRNVGFGCVLGGVILLYAVR